MWSLLGTVKEDTPEAGFGNRNYRALEEKEELSPGRYSRPGESRFLEQGLYFFF
jgi:hypothetical protein